MRWGGLVWCDVGLGEWVGIIPWDEKGLPIKQIAPLESTSQPVRAKQLAPSNNLLLRLAR